MVARKTSKDPTRIWSFHSERPVTCVKLVQDLIFLGNNHYNNLIRIERDRAESFKLIRERHVPGLDAARLGLKQVEREYKEVNELVKKARAKEYRRAKGEKGKTKKTRAVPPELKAQYEELKARKKALYDRHRELAGKFKALTEPATAEWKRRREERAGKAGPRIKERVNAEVLAEMLAEDWPEAWKDVARLDAGCLQRQKDARATSGLPHGCYLLVENAAAQAIKTSRPLSPRFRRFDGSGRVGVQVTGGATFGDALDGKSRFLRLRPSVIPGARGKQEQFFIASMQFGKEWADFPVRLHRLPPRDAELKWAWFRFRRVGGERFKCEIQLTLQGESLVRERAFGSGAVEVRFCSQARERGTCVAAWTARETGEIGEVVLPRHVIERLDFPAVLRAHADAHVDEILRVLSLWSRLAGNKVTGIRRPSKQVKRDPKKAGKRRGEGTRVWLRNNCSRRANEILGNERLTGLWQEWRAERLGANKDLFPHLTGAARWCRARGLTPEQSLWFWAFLWTLKDRHLRQMAGQMRERAENQRDAIYRNEAIGLSKVFGELVHFGQKLAEEKKTPKVEEESNEFQRVRTVRQNVAPGRCREIMLEVFGDRVEIERSGDDDTPGGSRDSGKDAGSGASAEEYLAAE